MRISLHSARQSKQKDSLPLILRYLNEKWWLMAVCASNDKLGGFYLVDVRTSCTLPRLLRSRKVLRQILPVASKSYREVVRVGSHCTGPQR